MPIQPLPVACVAGRALHRALTAYNKLAVNEQVAGNLTFNAIMQVKEEMEKEIKPLLP